MTQIVLITKIIHENFHEIIARGTIYTCFMGSGLSSTLRVAVKKRQRDFLLDRCEFVKNTSISKIESGLDFIAW
jgi:hypothetical protein